jgi:AcrR family transcriptional regulator
MKHIRLTREQSKNQTRQHLLDAAQAIFLNDGFAATSVEDIAETAGYTRGAFYSNFRSKTEVLLELLRRDHEAMHSDLQAITGAEYAHEAIGERVLHYYSRLHRGDKSSMLWTEARLLAARDPCFGASYNAFRHEKLRQLTDCIREFSARACIQLPLPAEHLATGLMGLRDGVQLFHALDPERVPAGLAESVLAVFFGRVVLGRDMK